MNRRTTIAIAGGATLIVAAVAAAIGVNLGIMSGADAESGPGTFEPAAAIETSPPPETSTTVSIPTSTTTPTTAPDAAPTTSPGTSPTISDDDDSGRDHPEDGEHRSGDDDGVDHDLDDDHGGDRDQGPDDDSRGHGSGSDDDD